MAIAATGQAATISIQTRYEGNGLGVALAPTDVVGVQSVSRWNTYFNQGGDMLPRTVDNLTDSTGATTAVDFAIANNNSWG